ncbi:unnamed protein product [Anisakis simplex]|uniref:C2H2-type domain-containing protein n=1 Tax=Anisakis simplex TaxID=6269 RepID=A0A0M3JZN5_ANISI|nr:unnamed protein product [Anisakis simplex]
MLRQLLSSGGIGGGGGLGMAVKMEPQPVVYTPQSHYPTASMPLQQSLHNPEVVIKNEDGEKSLAVLSNMPQIAYCPTLHSAPAMMMKCSADAVNGHISGTTELFSSTFAMLSGDNAVPDADWSSSSYRPEKPLYQPNETYTYSTNNNNNSNNQVPLQATNPVYSNQPVQVLQTTFPQQQLQQQQNYQIVTYTNGMVQANAENVTDLQRVENIVDADEERKKEEEKKAKRKEKHRFTQEFHTISFREVAEIPLSSSCSGRDTPGADGESEGDERVMCMACRGVYPSRRSLTGHIGRNEKCREIIGRSYLGHLSGVAKESLTGMSGSPSAQDSLSPICPYCDRFISHYKGNIRRHVNQCMKCIKPRRKRSNRKTSSSSSTPQSSVDYLGDGSDYIPGGSQSNDAFYDGYQPHALSNQEWMNGFDSTSSPPVHSNQLDNSETKGPDDPYLCSLCDFATLYKGNMKRHLSTCHSLADEELQDCGIDSLRASRCAENAELHNRACKGRRTKAVLDAYDGRKRPKMNNDEAMKNTESASNTNNTDTNHDQFTASSVQLSDAQSNDSSTTNSNNCVELSIGTEDSAQLKSPTNGNLAQTQMPSSTEVNDTNAQQQQQLLPVKIEQNSSESQSESDRKTIKASYIEDIVNAVAANQIGSVTVRKADIVGMAAAGAARTAAVAAAAANGTPIPTPQRRGRAPKKVQNMDEVRDYWETERMNSGGVLPLSSTYNGRPRGTHYAAFGSTFMTGNGAPANQH